MRRILQPVLAVFMLAVFLAGTTGVSFYIHTCSESHKRSIYAYPEIIKPVSACCSEGAVSPMTEKCDQPQGINAACCRNEHIYLKAAFVSVPVTLQEFSTFVSESQFPLISELIAPSPDNSFRDNLIPTGNSPPITGKTLVFYIHQIRIPSPASLS